MDDASQFGEVAYILTFREAVDRNILVDYQPVVAVVNWLKTSYESSVQKILSKLSAWIVSVD